MVAHHCCAAWSFGVAARTTSIKSSQNNHFHFAHDQANNLILVGVDHAGPDLIWLNYFFDGTVENDPIKLYEHFDCILKYLVTVSFFIYMV